MNDLIYVPASEEAQKRITKPTEHARRLRSESRENVIGYLSERNTSADNTTN